jgi:tellurite resistance protein TerC
MTHTALMWLVLVAAAGAAFMVDQRAHRDEVTGPSLKRSAIETVIWTAAGLSFGFVVWAMIGGSGALQFVTGYTLEKSLSLDNVAVFAVIVATLGIPATRQRRLIDHAILAAIVLRLAFIAGGLALLDHVHAVLYLFGAVLVASGIRMFRSEHDDGDAGPPKVIGFARRWLPISDDLDTQRYVVRSADRRWSGTMLLVALVALALVDVVFAIDSVPAIFSVTRDAWIVSAANAFALLGMRPMYFLLAEGINQLKYLQRGLAVILVGVGVDMLIEEQVVLPTAATLGFVLAILTVSVLASLRSSRKSDRTRATYSDGRRVQADSPAATVAGDPELARSASTRR